MEFLKSNHLGLAFALMILSININFSEGIPIGRGLSANSYANQEGDDQPFGPNSKTKLSPELQQRVLERLNSLIPEIANGIMTYEREVDKAVKSGTMYGGRTRALNILRRRRDLFPGPAAYMHLKK